MNKMQQHMVFTLRRSHNINIMTVWSDPNMDMCRVCGTMLAAASTLNMREDKQEDETSVDAVMDPMDSGGVGDHMLRCHLLSGLFTSLLEAPPAVSVQSPTQADSRDPNRHCRAAVIQWCRDFSRQLLGDHN